MINSLLLSLEFPVSTKRNGHETNTCKSCIDFILFHSEKLLLAFDSWNCCHGQHWKSVLASVYNQRTSSSEKSGGMHCQILHYLLHINYLRFGNTHIDIVKTLRSGISRLGHWAFPVNNRRSAGSHARNETNRGK